MRFSVIGLLSIIFRLPSPSEERASAEPPLASSQEQESLALEMTDPHAKTQEMLNQLFPEGTLLRKWRIGNAIRPRLQLEIEASDPEKFQEREYSIGIVDFADIDEKGLPLWFVFGVTADGRVMWADKLRAYTEVDESKEQTFVPVMYSPVTGDSSLLLNSFLCRFIKLGEEISPNSAAPITYRRK